MAKALHVLVLLAVLAGAAACAGRGPGPATEPFLTQPVVEPDDGAAPPGPLAAYGLDDEEAAGGQLVRMRDTIGRARARHVVARGSVGHDIRDVGIAGKVAYVVDCVDVDGWLQYDATTGAVQPDQVFDRPRQLARYTLAPRDGGWLVTDAQELGTC